MPPIDSELERLFRRARKAMAELDRHMATHGINEVENGDDLKLQLAYDHITQARELIQSVEESEQGDGAQEEQGSNT